MIIFGGLFNSSGGSTFSVYGSVNGPTVYFPLGGVPSAGYFTELWAQFTVETTWTLENFGIQLSGNSYDATSTPANFHSRISGSNGTITISVAGAGTGWLTDTSHSDSLASDLVNLAFTSLITADEVATLQAWSAKISGTQGSCLCGSSNPVYGDGPPTPYASAFGLLIDGQAESSAKYYVGTAGTSNSLSVTVTQTGGDTFTVQSRIDGVDGTQVLSLNSGNGTGNHVDTSHTDSWAAGSLVDTTYSDSGNAYLISLITYQLTSTTTGKCDIGVTHCSTLSTGSPYYSYSSLGGFNDFGNLTESTVQVRSPTSATFSLFRSQGTTDGASFFATVRNSGAENGQGNEYVTVSGMAWVVDSSHSDSITSSDSLDYSFQVVSGSPFVSQTGLSAVLS